MDLVFGVPAAVNECTNFYFDMQIDHDV